MKNFREIFRDMYQRFRTWSVGRPSISGILADGKKPCLYCREEINTLATVCSRCGHGQSRLGNLLRYLPGIMAFIALVQMILATAQYMEAREKRIEVDQAATKATQALEEAQKLRAITKDAADEATSAKNLAEHLKQQTARADVQLAVLSNAQMKASAALSDINTQAEFANLMVRMDNDDRNAFETIAKLSSAEDHPYREVAYRAYLRAIRRAAEVRDAPDVELSFAEEVELKNAEEEERILEKKVVALLGAPPSTLSWNQFFDVMFRTRLDDRPQLFKILWKRCSAIPEYYKLNALMVEMARTPSTKVLATVCSLVEQKAQIGGNFLNPKAYEDWWQQAKSAYPEDKTYEAASQYYSALYEAWFELHPDAKTNKVIRIPREFVDSFAMQWARQHRTNEVDITRTNLLTKPPTSPTPSSKR